MARTCTVGGCAKPHVARGYCRNHYSLWYDNGSPHPTRMYRAPVADRLRSKLVETEAGCLEFIGWTDARGYGRFKVAGKMVKPHRVAYELWVGPIPDGLFVCHHCDNPPCCNPEHLFTGGPIENMQDMWAKGRGDVSGLVAPPDLGARLSARAARLRVGAALSAGCPEDWKRCYRCQTFKAPEAFGPNRRRADGLQTYCRDCWTLYRIERGKR